MSIFDLGERHFASIGDHKIIPGGIVSAISQDANGFVWIGTQQGALRYDGYQFKLYKHERSDANSLAGNYIRAIWAAPEGKVWFGTFGDGISVLEPTTGKFTRYILSENNEDFGRNAIRDVLGESLTRVWVANNGGLSFINPQSNQVVNVSKINGCSAVYDQQSVRSLRLDDFDGLWIGTQNGLCRINLPPPEHQKDVLIGKSYPEFDGFSIHNLLFAEEQVLWLGTVQNGIAKYDIQTQTTEWLTSSTDDLSNAWVVSMIKADDNDVWVGTLDGGISVVNIADFKVRQIIRHDKNLSGTINLNNIGALFKDKQDLIWVGTWGSGLNLFDPVQDNIRTIRHSHDKNNTIKPVRIRAIAETDAGDIWLGYNQAGISKVSLESRAITNIDAQPNSPGALQNGDILALKHTKDGEVWIGTRSRGLMRYDPITEQFISYEDYIPQGLRTIMGFTLENEQRLWIATSRGIWFADLASKEVSNTKDYEGAARLSQKVVYSIAWQKPDSLWIGTDEGLFHMSPESQTVQFLHPQQDNTINLSDNAINSLYVDHNNQLWVATESGLDKLNSWDGEVAEFTSLHRQLGLENEYTTNILSDYKGRIWYHKGVFDIKQNRRDILDENYAWSVGTIWLGSALKTQDDKILFGGTDGLLIIEPDSYERQARRSSLQLTQLQIDNQNRLVPADKNLTLSPDNQSLTMEFSALDFARSDTIQYAWCLKGFDAEWIIGENGERRANYTNLPPGEYEFTVRYRGHNQEWSVEKQLLSVTILPAWYETNIARGIFLLMLSGLIGSIFYARTRQLVRQKRHLDEQVQQKTKELSQANLDKDRIMSILAHDINNKMSISMGYLDLLKLSLGKASEGELDSYVEKAISNSKSCAELVAELRDFGKLSSESNEIALEYTDLIEASQNIIEFHQPSALKKNIQLVFEHDNKKTYCGLHKNKFTRILDNLLNNAIKYSHPGEMITVAVKSTGVCALLSVKDTGVGIPDDIQKHLFSDFIQSGRSGTSNETSSGLGLYIVKKLVDQHQGQLWFESRENRGTTFYVEFPLA